MGLAVREQPSIVKPLVRDEEIFTEIVWLIEASRHRALQAVNSALIDLYWQVGEIISRKIEAAGSGTFSARHHRYTAGWQFCGGRRNYRRSITK
jgi:hypothetical protein